MTSEPLTHSDALFGESFRSLDSVESRVRAAFDDATADGAPVHMSRRYRIAKRSLDVLVASVLLLILSPALLIIALLVWTDSPGPVFFVQRRIGQGARLFRMYKFRSMRVGVPLFGTRDQAHKCEHDQRVTRVGRWLRRLSIDELPQLLNVIKGDMSLVGPRPEIPEIALSYYEPWQYRRLAAPQGITGWWQVNGRSSRIMHEHTADDLHYIENASFWFDLRLLAMTVRAVIGRNGAF